MICCDRCGKEVDCTEFDCYSPKYQESKKKRVFQECISRLVENYFDPTKTGSW